MEQAYAQALMRAVEGGMAPHAAVKAVKEILEKSGRTALLPRVARALGRLAEREERKSGITLTVAREKDERQAKASVKRILADMEADADDLRTRVDDSLIGGWRLEGRGMLIDKSYKSRLLHMYNRSIR